MKIEIKNRWNGSILFSIEAANIKLALEAAVKSGASLKGASLKGARLETGETWQEYLTEVLPALFAAGGKNLAEVITPEHWNCHEWDNCPMAAAFDVHETNKAPALWRHRIEQFIRFFDAGLISFEAVEPLLPKKEAV